MSNVLSHDDYRAVLREELARRCQANPRYSQRAFARDLALRPNRLSEILNAKQGVSRLVAAGVAKTLGYSAAEREHFLDLVDSLHARSPARRKVASARARRAKLAGNALADDTFQVLADWHHLAILELTALTGFKDDARWIARALGVQENVAAGAVARLLALGLLVRAGGKLAAANGVDIAPGGAPSAAIRRFHAQVLAKAQAALATQPVEAREVSTALLAVKAADVPKAKRLIQTFVGEFCAAMGATAPGQGADALYAVGLQFFKIAPEGPEGEA